MTQHFQILILADTGFGSIELMPEVRRLKFHAVVVVLLLLLQLKPLCSLAAQQGLMLSVAGMRSRLLRMVQSVCKLNQAKHLYTK